MFTQWALRPDFGGRRPASRRARRDLRDRGAGRGRRRRVPARRARQVSAVRRRTAAERRRSTASSTRPTAGEATPPLVSKITDIAIRRGQKVRLETPGGGGFGDPRDARSRARRARRAARLRVARGGAARLQGRAARRRLARRRGHRAKSARVMSRRRHRRRRRRRHLHRPVLASTRRAAASAPPRCRRAAATRRSASSTASRRSAAPAAIGVDRARHHGRHQHAAGAARAEDRRDHDARLSRRAGDAPARPPPHLGPVGRFRPDRRPRHAARGDRAHARRRHDPHAGRSGGGPRRRASSCSRSGAQARRRSSSSTPTPMPRTSAARSPRVRAVWPNEYVTASHEVLSEIREFERSSTAALNAYLQPVVASYLGKLRRRARAQQSFPASCTSCSRTAASCRPRPRAGCRCAPRCPARPPAWSRARRSPSAAGFDNLITCDLGGTSFDVSVIAGGKAAVAAQTTIDFGLVIRTPMIEITTIGAGGGSIASVDRGGLLQVGPESAGSVPGPACYGAGNTRPTLTDAQVVLGRINAQRPLGGELEVARRRGGARARSTRACRRAARPRHRRRRGRDRARRRGAHGRRDPPRLDRARPRSGAIRRDAVRRRRRAACRRADPRDRAEVARWCRAFPASPRRSAACSPTCATTCVQTAQRDARRPRRGGARAAAWRAAGAGGERRDRGGRHSRSSASTSSTSSTCTISARPTRCAVPLPVAAQDATLGVSEAMVRTAFEAAYLAVVQPPAARAAGAHRLAARRRDRPPPAVRFLGVRAGRRPRRSTTARRGTRPVWFDGGWRDTGHLVAARSAGGRARSTAPPSSSSPTPPR